MTEEGHVGAAGAEEAEGAVGGAAVRLFDALLVEVKLGQAAAAFLDWKIRRSLAGGGCEVNLPGAEAGGHVSFVGNSRFHGRSVGQSDRTDLALAHAHQLTSGAVQADEDHRVRGQSGSAAGQLAEGEVFEVEDAVVVVCHAHHETIISAAGAADQQRGLWVDRADGEDFALVVLQVVNDFLKVGAKEERVR